MSQRRRITIENAILCVCHKTLRLLRNKKSLSHFHIGSRKAMRNFLLWAEIFLFMEFHKLLIRMFLSVCPFYIKLLNYVRPPTPTATAEPALAHARRSPGDGWRARAQSSFVGKRFPIFFVTLCNKKSKILFA